MRATVLVEQARFEEHRNNLPKARAILARAKKETVHEWKVFLESVLLEIRANNLEGALKEVQTALVVRTTQPSNTKRNSNHDQQQQPDLL